VVADADIADPVANFNHDSDGLVAQGHRHGPRSARVNDRRIGMADACSLYADQQLTFARGVELQLCIPTGRESL